MSASAPRVGAFVMTGGTSPDARASIPFARAIASIVPSTARVSEQSFVSAPLPVRVPSRALRGVVAGTVAGAALLGLLVGIGRRAGTTWRPMNAAAHGLLGAKADGVWSFQGSVTPVGGLVVLVMSVAAGVAVARIAPTFRTLHVVMVALGVACIGYLLHVHVVARTPGGLADLLTIGELRSVYLMLAAALIAGMRFAFSTGAAALER
jgi:hypothetical protein